MLLVYRSNSIEIDSNQPSSNRSLRKLTDNRIPLSILAFESNDKNIFYNRNKAYIFIEFALILFKFDLLECNWCSFGTSLEILS